MAIYQLNLVLKDGTRVHLSTHRDLDWHLSTAQDLAGFLNVPLLNLVRP